jgi:hypothetical protein
MNFKILEFPNRNLCVYNNDVKVFYSTCKFKWGNRKTTEIYNEKSIKLFEVEYDGYFYDKFSIIFQNESLKNRISKIESSKIILENSSEIVRKSVGLNLTNSNFSYYFKSGKIAKSKVIKWVNGKIYNLEIDDIEKELQELLIIKFLILESGRD